MEAFLVLSASTAAFSWAVFGCCEKIDVDDDDGATGGGGRRRRKHHRSKPPKTDPEVQAALQVLKPKEMKKGSKEKAIARGQKCDENQYPTMEDVVSDWKSAPMGKPDEKKK